MVESRRNFALLGLLVITGGLLLIVVAPIVTVLLGSFLNTAFLGLSSEQWVGSATGGELITFKWFRYVLELYWPQMTFGFWLALGNVAVSLLIGVVGGYALVRRAFPGCGLLEDLLLLPLSIPGLTISLGLLQAYGMIRGKWWLLLAGQVLYTIPFMVRSVTSTLRSFDFAAQERAARTLGCGFWRAFWFVTLPNLRHAIVVGALLVFAISWGEFNVSFLLSTPIYQGFPSALFATYTTNSFQVSSAATTLFLLVIVPVLLLIQGLGGRELSKIEQGA